MCLLSGHDRGLVHEKSGVGFQMRERIHDRDGILGWCGIEEFTIPRTKGSMI